MSRLPFRTACFVLLLLAHHAATVQAQAHSAPRRLIVVFEFYGLNPGSAQLAFGNFRDILEMRQFTLLTEQLRLPQNRLVLSVVGGPRPTDKEKYWRDSGSLTLISGGLFEQNGFLVDGDIFLGDLAEGLPTRSLPFSFRIQPGQYSATKDTYSVVTVFALAMDAEHSGEPRSEVIRYLQHALNLAKDLTAGASPPPEALKLRAAIEAHLQKLKAER